MNELISRKEYGFPPRTKFVSIMLTHHFLCKYEFYAMTRPVLVVNGANVFLRDTNVSVIVFGVFPNTVMSNVMLRICSHDILNYVAPLFRCERYKCGSPSDRYNIFAI